MIDALVQIGQLILMLSILVILHEFGHYLPAKWFKTKVEKFYLFFDPWFSIVKKKIGETTYGIGWLPLGGYVKIAGMIDESMDKDQMKSEPQPWEFRSKPAWQRLIIMLGGVTVNVLLAWLILTILFAMKGQNYESVSKMEHGFEFSELGHEIGFKDGDKIISVDGKKPEQFNRLILDVLLSDEILVDRNGNEVKLNLTDEQIKEILSNGGRTSFMFPRLKGVIVDSVAKQNGLQKNDKILALNNQPINYFGDLKKILKNYKNDSIDLKIERANQQINIKTFVNDSAQIGFVNKLDVEQFKSFLVKNKFNIITAIPLAIKESFTILNYNLKQFKLIIKPKTEAYKQAAGPIGIARKLPTTWNWEFFWNFTAMFSMWLAFVNLLPIPGLDGGHALFTIAEMITGKKLNDKAMGVVQTIGMVILLSLMVLIFGKDIYELIRDKFFM